MRKTVLIAALIALPVVCQEAEQPRLMLWNHLTKVAYEQLAARRAKVDGIRTLEAFEHRRTAFRSALLKMIGGLPFERPPLALRRTGRIERDGYRVEKIVFESQPGFFVTANLYVPAGKGPFPAVLHSVGHSAAAKNRAFYQTLSIGLVKSGFVVLTYDPLGQGERRIFWDRELGDSKAGGTTVEHEMVGIQSLLGGESIARWMIWDGMRAIDLLESLPEVDRKRIGITGCSGGGTQTAYLAALDDRVRVAAPACYITSWEEQLRSGLGPQDAEQQFSTLLEAGYDHADFVEAFAPKPYLICSTDQDFFPLAGAERTYNEAQRIYGLFDSAERIAWFHEPGGHGTPKATREAIYGWMKHWLAGSPSGSSAEPRILTEYEEDLNATPTGQLATSQGGLSASEMVRHRLAAHLAARAHGDTAAAALALTRYRKPDAPPQARGLGGEPREGYRLERLRIEGPGGRMLPAWLAKPAVAARGTVLWSGEHTGATAFAALEDLDELARAGYTAMAVDLSGRGATAPDSRGYSEAWFGSEKETWLALMTGRTMVGMRAADVVTAVNWLDAQGLARGGVIGFGKGGAAVDLLHASAFDHRLKRLILEDMLVSWAALARSPLHRRMFEVIVPGALCSYDLPDLARTIAPRPVTILNARSPMGTVLPRAEAARAYAGAKTVRTGLRRESESILETCPELR